MLKFEEERSMRNGVVRCIRADGVTAASRGMMEMGAEPLAAVCELAFVVAKEGVDATPSIDPPAPMRSYLYVAQLPVRAFTVTEQVLDEDPAFRERVAERATEEAVGRAGYLWLHRTSGWEAEYFALVGTHPRSHPRPPMSSVPPISPSYTPPPTPPSSGAPVGVVPPIPDPPVPSSTTADINSADSADIDAEHPVAPIFQSTEGTPMTSNANGSASGDVPDAPADVSPETAVPETAVAETAVPETAVLATASPEPAQAPAARTFSADSIIGDELSSLKEMVDRLADERRNVRESVRDLETEVESRRAETHEMSNHLQSLERDLTASRAAEAEITTERDSALARVNELVAERDGLKADRDGDRASVANALAERDAALVDSSTIQERLDRTEQARSALEIERNAFGAERDNLRSEKATLVGSNADLVRRLGVAEQARVDLEAQLDEISSKWQTLTLEVASLGSRRVELIDQVAQLSSERDATAAAQRDLVDSINGQLDEIRNERQLIADRLELTQQHLGSTRGAIDDARQSVVDELERADQVVADSVDAVASIDRITSTITANVTELETLEGAPIEVPADPGFGPEVLAALDTEVAEEAPNDSTWETESEPALESSTPPEPPDPEIAEPVATTPDVATSPDSELASTELASTELSDIDIVAPEQPIGSDLGDIAGFLDEEVPNDEVVARASLDEALANYGMGADDLAPSPSPESTVEADSTAAFDDVSGPASTVSGRTKLVVPAPIVGDDFETAKFMAYGTDVVLLVDGDTAANRGWGDYAVIDGRRALVGYLTRLASEAGTAADVVLYHSVSDEFPEPKSVRIRECDDSSPRPTYFANIVDGYPPEWPVVVVTDDLEIEAAVDARGASLMSSLQLLDVLQEFYEEA